VQWAGLPARKWWRFQIPDTGLSRMTVTSFACREFGDHKESRSQRKRFAKRWRTNRKLWRTTSNPASAGGGEAPTPAIYEERVVKCWMQKMVSPGWRFPSPSASVGASPRPASLGATLVEDSLSLRWREVIAPPLLFIEVWPTRREDAQPSIQDRAATCGQARGKHVLRNRIQGDATIHTDESRWRKGHRLLAGAGVVPSRLVHPSA
jgi:hypothetical protein